MKGIFLCFFLILFSASIPEAQAQIQQNDTVEFNEPNTISTKNTNNLFAVINQTFQVKGTLISNATNLPLSDVAIQEKDTENKTTSNADGKFTITISKSDAILVFSTQGYSILEMPVEGKTEINIVMMASIETLLDMVVVGYGTMKKGELTSSSARIPIEARDALTATNLLSALSGTTAGVNIQSTGLAGAEPVLSIRGLTSLSASGKPLIVLDGIIYDGDISNLNINDVEAVDILKDAGAASIYGSRSANGVLLITTKTGKTEKSTISFNMSKGVQTMTNNPLRVMNGDEYAMKMVDFYYQQSLYAWYKTNPASNEGKPVYPDISDRNFIASKLNTQEERDNYMAGREIDWMDQVLRTASIGNFNLSISGKTDRNNYYFSSSYTKEEGIQLNDQFTRYILHGNIEHKISDWLSLGINTNYTFRDYSGVKTELGNGTIEGARACSPWADNKIGLPDYDLFLTGEVYMPYPLNTLYVENSDTKNDLFLIGKAKLTIPWVKGLNYEFNYSNNFSNQNNNTFYPANTFGGYATNGLAYKIPYEQRNFIINNILSYTNTFDDHQINTTLLYSWEETQAQGSTLTAQDFDNPALGYNNMGLGNLQSTASEAWQENSIGYMVRGNYIFKNRYLITGTFRKDGYSGFAPNKKFANFPSVSLGWVVSDESFMTNFKNLYLKLRASYGKTGNQGIGRYSSLATMSSASYVYGTGTAVSIYPNTLGNENLEWETTSLFNLGFDAGLYDNRITGSVELYKSYTDKVLVKRALPPTSGYSSIWANMGAIENKGVECNLNTLNLIGLFKWTSNFTFTINRDNITKLYGGENDKDITNSWFVGEPIQAIYDLELAGGIWTEEELYNKKTFAGWYPGQLKYADLNTDRAIDMTHDRKVIGYKTPNYLFSITNTFIYKDFSLSFMINSIQGGNGYFMENNAAVLNTLFNTDQVKRVNLSAVRPYWTPENGVNNATGIYNAPPVASGIYEDRSFVRLQNVTLTYTLNPKLLSKIKISGCHLFLSGRNIYTWTKWSGWDPENAVADTPLMRTFTTGFNITF